MNKHEKKDWKKFNEENKFLDEDLVEETKDASEQTTEQEPALGHPTYKALEDQLTLAEQKAHENWEKSVRAIAELDNVRRRMERELANAHKYGPERLLIDLLPVIDSLEQAIQLADKNTDESMHEGLVLTMKVFLDVLQKFNVEQLDPVGELFDPHQHEAISIQDAPDAQPNSVISVFQKGYKLNDRIIRPARVIVSKRS